MYKERIVLLLMLAAVIFCSCKGPREDEVILSTGWEQSDNQQEDGTFLKDTTSVEFVYVYVCGEVKKPDVYKLLPGARVFDAISAAGGMTDTASSLSVNQARVVQDGEQIYIPSQEDEKFSEDSVEPDDGRINLNTATREQLLTLPGIGEAKADLILTYREEHGSFSTVEDIKKINGIKDGVYNKIKDLIIIN